MDIERRLRPDLWKAVQAHYERKDYTEAVRDTVFHMSELLREKSGLEDKDGSKLVEAALLGSNPAIVVRKNETTTEKDYQQGIGYSFKGIMQAIRNPLSHEKTEYSQEDSEAIILYINFLLNQIDHSGGTTKIDDIMRLLYDEDFTPTDEYAELLLKEVPSKKRYDLLVELFSNRTELHQHVLRNFIRKLYDSLTKASKIDFVRMLNASLMVCKDDRELRMYLHYFMEQTYAELDKLVQLRIERFIYKSILNGKMILKIDTMTGEEEHRCNSEGSLATWVCGKCRIDCLGNKTELLSTLVTKICDKQEAEEEYVFEYFSEFLLDNVDKLSEGQIKRLNIKLAKGDEYIYNWLLNDLLLDEDEKLVTLFGESFKACETVLDNIEQEERLPF